MSNERRETIRGGAMEDAIEEHARWAAEGLRLGEMRAYRGEQLRDLGLEPSGNPDDGRSFRVTHVDESSITLEAMSEQKIEPALSAKEWRDEMDFAGPSSELTRAVGVAVLSRPKDPKSALRALIALANHALEDDDPRKITRNLVHGLRQWATRLTLEGNGEEELNAIADALESYLPPEAV
jgi:hypothetical protein